MNDELSPLPAPLLLAIAYTPASVRERFGWLLQFDRRLDEVLARAKEPLIVQMRLAWWREMLAKSIQDRPKGEPLLNALGVIDADRSLQIAAMALVDAAEQYVGEANDQTATHARALAICTAYVDWINGDPFAKELAEKLAMLWAGRNDAMMASVPRSLRPLSILALAAQLEARSGRAKGLRLNWHALTGR